MGAEPAESRSTIKPRPNESRSTIQARRVLNIEQLPNGETRLTTRPAFGHRFVSTFLLCACLAMFLIAIYKSVEKSKIYLLLLLVALVIMVTVLYFVSHTGRYILMTRQMIYLHMPGTDTEKIDNRNIRTMAVRHMEDGDHVLVITIATAEGEKEMAFFKGLDQAEINMAMKTIEDVVYLPEINR